MKRFYGFAGKIRVEDQPTVLIEHTGKGMIVHEIKNSPGFKTGARHPHPTIYIRYPAENSIRGENYIELLFQNPGQIVDIRTDEPCLRTRFPCQVSGYFNCLIREI